MTARPTADVRPPRQRRSRASYERVLDAASSLLAENGFDGVTVQAVAGRSQVSIGAIYTRFGSKENLLRAVHAQLIAAMTAVTKSRAPVGASTAREAIAVSVDLVAHDLREHDRILAPFMHMGAVDSVIAKRGSEGSIELGRVFKAVVLEHRDEIAHRDPEIGVDVAFRIVYCTFARQIMYGSAFESDRDVTWSELIAELTSACTAFLLRPVD